LGAGCCKRVNRNSTKKDCFLQDAVECRRAVLEGRVCVQGTNPRAARERKGGWGEGGGATHNIRVDKKGKEPKAKEGKNERKKKPGWDNEPLHRVSGSRTIERNKKKEVLRN